MKNILQATALLAGGAIGILSQTTYADFIGATVDVKYAFPTQSVIVDSSTKTVQSNGGIGTSFSVNDYDININSSVITINGFGGLHGSFGSTYNGWIFAEMPGPTITGVSIDPLHTNLNGLNSSQISFDASDIDMNWAGDSYNQAGGNPPAIVTLDVRFAGTDSTPLPSSAFAGAALLACCSLRRLRRHPLHS